HSRYGRVKGGEHTHSAALPRNHAFGRKIIRSAVDAGGANAAIFVADQDAAFLIDGGIVEVEQVAAGTALTDAAALNRITGRDILRGPCRATVECSRDIQIPNASEVCALSTFRSFSAIPISAVVFRKDDRLFRAHFVKRHAAAASGVRHINGAVRGRNLEVTMQTLAVGSGEHRCGRLAKNKPTVVAAEGAGVRHALRSVIDRVLI